MNQPVQEGYEYFRTLIKLVKERFDDIVELKVNEYGGKTSPFAVLHEVARTTGLTVEGAALVFITKHHLALNGTDDDIERLTDILSYEAYTKARENTLLDVVPFEHYLTEVKHLLNYPYDSRFEVALDKSVEMMIILEQKELEDAAAELESVNCDNIIEIETPPVDKPRCRCFSLLYNREVHKL